MQKNQVDHAIDTICKRGCQYVSSLLGEMSLRGDCKELMALNSIDQQRVIDELKTVMSVYDGHDNRG